MAKKDAKSEAPAAAQVPATPPFMRTFYRENVVPALKKSRGYKNPHQVPTIEKVVINTALRADADRGWIAEVVKEIGLIAGQQPIITKARKSISNFKVREGMPLGVKVTLRGARMYDFLYRLLAVALPAIRDFQGVPTKCDGQGNYTLGITDHTIFPEINVDTNKRSIGMDLTIVTTASDDEEARELLKLMGMPFRKTTKEKEAEEAAAREAAKAAEAASA
ncbi:MAG: 50S ribosomal protein L5 [Opitutales bacterium]